MLVTLRKQDLFLHCFDDDVEKYMADRERKHYKKKFYLPGIRKTIFSNFEVFFGVSENGDIVTQRFDSSTGDR